MDRAPGGSQAPLDESTGGFEVFRRRASSERGARDENWRIGFDPAYREGQGVAIAQTIVAELFRHGSPPSMDDPVLLDIGSGSGALTDALTVECAQRGITHAVVDSAEMLLHVPDLPYRTKIPGQFPEDVTLSQSELTRIHFIVAYSVLQYVVREADPLLFVLSICELLPTGGVALIGDLPNRDQRDRQLAASGLPIPAPAEVPELRDQALLDLTSRIRANGLNAYLIPQQPSEPMRLHRENLLIVKPAPYNAEHSRK